MSGMRQLPGLLKQAREGVATSMTLLISVISCSAPQEHITIHSSSAHRSPRAVVEEAFPGVSSDGNRMKTVEAADRFVRVSRWLVAQYLLKERELRALRIVREREQRQQQQKYELARGADTGWTEPSKASCLQLLAQVGTLCEHAFHSHSCVFIASTPHSLSSQGPQLPTGPIAYSAVLVKDCRDIIGGTVTGECRSRFTASDA